MSDFRGNIDHWLRQSEPDYYIFFLKAWIPFNAWYVAELPHLNKKDGKIIKELQDNPKSKPRQIIENFLKSNNPSDYDSIRFKNHLSELHHQLDIRTLKHNGEKLSFKNLTLTENPKKFEKDIDKQGNLYKAEVKLGFYEALIVDKNNRTIMHFKQPSFNLLDLEKHNDYIKIPRISIQKKIKKCFEAIDPQKTVSLISTIKSKTNSIYLQSEHSEYFINDPTTIAKGCINILYALRCMLFHGELEPTPSNKPVYEQAYNLLRLILKNL